MGLPVAEVVAGVVAVVIWTVAGCVDVAEVVFLIVVFLVVGNVVFLAVVAAVGGCGFCLVVFLVGIGGFIIIMGDFLLGVVGFLVVVVGTGVVVGFLLITNSANKKDIFLIKKPIKDPGV